MSTTLYRQQRGVFKEARSHERPTPTKHVSLDCEYPEGSVADELFAIIRFGDKILVCRDPSLDAKSLKLISGPSQQEPDAFKTIEDITRLRTGLELSHYGIARFTFQLEGVEKVGQVVTCRASERKDAAQMNGAKFMRITEVIENLADFGPGVREAITQVETMSLGFGKFVRDASERAVA